LKVIISAPLGHFQRPGNPGEPSTYPVITPTACEGVINAVYWHPGHSVQVKSISVLNPIKYTTDWVITKGTGTFNACINKKRSNIINAEYMGQWLVCLWHHAMQTASLQRGKRDLVECVIATHSNPYGNAQLGKISDLVQVDIDDRAQTHSIKINNAPAGVTTTLLSAAISDLLTVYPPTLN
jgi:CRISPR-associated Cas5-like protein